MPLFIYCICPILDYSAEDWGYCKQTKHDAVQKRAMRYFLAVHEMAPKWDGSLAKSSKRGNMLRLWMDKGMLSWISSHIYTPRVCWCIKSRLEFSISCASVLSCRKCTSVLLPCAVCCWSSSCNCSCFLLFSFDMVSYERVQAGHLLGYDT